MTTRSTVLAIAGSCLGRGPETFQDAAPGYDLARVSWCQIFWLHCLRSAGLTDKTWADLARDGWVHGWLPTTDDPQPGDLGYIDQPYQHGAVVQIVDRAGVHTIDGNSPGGIVAFRTRPKSAFTAFYSVAPLLAAATSDTDPAPPPSSPVVRGVDVSAWQRPDYVDWPRLRELGCTFAYIRTVKMGRTVDVHAAEHVARARAAGLSVGAYLFFSSIVDPGEQLDVAFQSFIKADIRPGDLATALDIESNPEGKTTSEWVDSASYMLERLKHHQGAAVRYHNVNDWYRMGRPYVLEKYPLWLADYTPPADLPCALWQFKSAIVKATDMVLDQNVAHADLPRIGHPMEAVVAAPRLEVGW
jgi:GH25 family lysozyme M1 (1,4-beta-N-acetylmuramidase)